MKAEVTPWPTVVQVTLELRDTWSVTIDTTFACLLWEGTKSGGRGGGGYGTLHEGGRVLMAHRAAYERAFGPIADALLVQHHCHRRHCVSPIHLEAYSKSENERDKQWSWRCRGKTCRWGHSMENAAVTRELGRTCRTCNRTMLEALRGMR